MCVRHQTAFVCEDASRAAVDFGGGLPVQEVARDLFRPHQRFLTHPDIAHGGGGGGGGWLVSPPPPLPLCSRPLCAIPRGKGGLASLAPKVHGAEGAEENFASGHNGVTVERKGRGRVLADGEQGTGRAFGDGSSRGFGGGGGRRTFGGGDCPCGRGGGIAGVRGCVFCLFVPSACRSQLCVSWEWEGAPNFLGVPMEC